MSGIPRPDPALATGTVVVRVVRGQLSNNVVGQPVDLLVGGKPFKTVKTDETGRAEFGGLAPGASARATTTVAGETLTSQEFPVPSQGGVRVLLVATDAAAAPSEPPRAPAPGTVVLGGDSRIVIQFRDDALQIFHLLEVLNTSRAPVITPAPLVFDLPQGATGVTILEDSSPQAVAAGPRVTVTGPFQPGKTAVQFAYQIEPSRGDFTIRQRLPAALQHLTVVVQKVGAIHVASPQFASHGDVETEDGPYIMASGPAIPAGGVLELSFTGVPHHGRTGLMVAVGLALGILAAGFWSAGAAGGDRRGRARQAELASRREKLLGDLVRLELQRRTRGADAHTDARRRELVRRLERIYGELDALGGRGGPGPDQGLAA